MIPVRIALLANSDQGTLSVSFPLTITAPRKARNGNHLYDVVIADIEVAGSNALDIIGMLAQSFPHSRIVVICPHPDGKLAQALIQRGVTGIVLRQEIDTGFTEIIRTVLTGKIVISPAIVGQIFAYQSTLA